MYQNDFKFGLYHDGRALVEKSFSADQLNPFTRYSVDIRELIPEIVEELIAVLSQSEYETEYCGYDFEKLNNDLISTYPKKQHNVLKFRPKVNTYGSVDFTFGLYINDKVIVEREFFVKDFNEKCLNSIDLVGSIGYISDLIFRYLKRDDVKHMWEDYDLIYQYNMNIQQVRSLPDEKRRSMLKRIRRLN